MADETTNRVPRHKLWQAVLGITLIALTIWAAWFLTSPRFNEFVRARLVGQLETMTGGRVELKAFRWNLSDMEFEADDLTIHGRESANETPYAHFDRLTTKLKVISFFSREFNVRTLSITHPVVHVVVYPDGTTNIPQPKRKRTGKSPTESLFELAIGRLELHQGMLEWNDRKIPIDVSAADVSGAMTYASAEKRYDGKLHVGRMESKYVNWRPVPAYGDVELSLYQDHAEIKSLRASSGKTVLEASGTISDFQNPVVSLTYKGTLDLQNAAATARVPGINGGLLDVQGKLNWTRDAYKGEGATQVRGFRWSVPDAHLRDASAGAHYVLTPDRLTLSHINAQTLGGTATGDAVVTNWSNQDPKSPANGTVNLHIAGLNAADIAEAFTTARLPLQELQVRGTADGQVQLRWMKNIKDLDVGINVAVSEATTETSPSLPVKGHFRGTFHLAPGTMDIAEAEVLTPATRVTASGVMGSTRAQLNLDVNSGRVQEFRPLINALRGKNVPPLVLNGSALFRGTLSGRLTQPTLVGHVELKDFTTEIPRASDESATGVMPSAQLPPASIVRWDSLTAEMRYGPDQLALSHATLRRGEAQIMLDAIAGLRKGRFADDLPLTVHAVLRDTQIGDLQNVAGYNYPVSGRLDANLQLTGTARNLGGSGHLRVHDAVAYGEQVLVADSDIKVTASDVQFRSARVSGPAGDITGHGTYNLKSAAFAYELHSPGLRLDQLRAVRKQRIRVQGTLAIDSSGSGTRKEPVLNATLRLRNLVMDGEPIGDLDAVAITRGDEMQISARSNFTGATLTADGSIRLRDNMPAQLTVDFRNLDVDAFLSSYMTQFRLTGHTQLDGHAVFDGPLRDPSRLRASGAIQRFTASVENVAISNEGPIAFTMRDQVFSLDTMHLVGQGTNLTASGTVGLAGDRAINFRGDGTLNLRVLQGISPELTSSGVATMRLTAGGTVAKPRLRGRIDVQDGAVSYVDLPNGLSGIEGRLVFTEDRLQVQQLRARTGGGELELGGFLTYQNGLAFNLTAHGKDIRLRYPPGVSATADAELTLAGTPKNSLLSGDVTITRFGLNPRFDFAQYLAQSKQPVQTYRPDSPLNGLRFDVHVVSTPELEVQTSLAKVSGNLDLRLRGTGTRPVVLGRVNIIEGDLVFNSTKYHLERGDVTFTNPVRIEPVLDIEASAHVRDYDIALGFHGPADHLSTTYRSDPPLPTADIIALLALGRTREESAQAQMYNPQTQQGAITDTASNALLGQALNATVSSRVQKLFGVSRIKIDPQVGGPENNANARLTIEQQVQNNITLTYITNLSQSAQQIIQVEYNLSRDVSIIAVRDQTGVLGFDVRIRQRKK